MRARLEAERRRISIDFSKLSGIRAEAALSCEALLVDEEREAGVEDRADAASESHPSEEMADETTARTEATADDAAVDDRIAADVSEDSHAATDAAASPFSPAEMAYLRLLLEGSSADERRAALQAAGISEAMMIDAVNEKALDELGDIVVEEGADGPELLEDYIEDVRGIVAA